MAARRQPLLHYIHRLAARLDPETDAVLLERFARQRDRVAFEALVQRHGAMVLGVCRRVLGNEHDAEDVFQATFLTLARKTASGHPPDSLPAWLHAVAHRLAFKHRQAQRRRQKRETRTAQNAGAASPRDPLEQLTGRELLQAVDEELQRLPESYRLPLLLCCLEGRTREEAAEMLGWTLCSVKARLQRGRTMLHTRLARRGLALGMGLLMVELGQGVKAALPARLSHATTEAALRFVAGENMGVAAGVLALTKRAMRLTGLKVASMLLGLALAISAGGLVACQIAAREEPEAKPRIDEPGPAAGTPVQAEQGGKSMARMDRYGDPLPPGALARLGTMRLRNNQEIRSLTFTPDGKGLLTAGGGDLPRLWDRATGKLIREFCVLDVSVSDAVLSLDGRLLAVQDWEGSVHLLETATGKRLRKFSCTKNNVRVCGSDLKKFAFTPDSKAIALHCGDNVELRDAATGRLLWQNNGSGIAGIAFSADGKTLASVGGTGGVSLWRRTKQTTPQGGGGAALDGSVIIDITALLELAAWCRQRLDALSGGTACPTPLDAPHPPAPEANRSPAGVGSPAGQPTEATPRTARPTPRPTPRGQHPQGGRP